MASEDTPRSRREFLKSAGVGIGFGALGLTASKSKYETVTIPITRSRHGVEHTKEVPQKWWKQVNRAKKVLENISQNETGVVQVNLVNSDRTIEGKHTFRIQKAVNPAEYRGKFTDEQRDGVRIETVQAEETVPLGCHNAGRYNTVQGSVAVSDDKGGVFSYGSTGARVFANNRAYMLTAAHIWNACGRSGVINDIAHQPFPNNRFGDIIAVNDSLDYILIGAGTRNIGGRIKDAGPVRGWVTQEGLCDFQANNTQVEKVGVTTGKTYGRIWTCNSRVKNGCIDFGYPDYGGVGTTATSAEGDSGSMVYWKNNKGNCFVVNIISLGQFEIKGVSDCFGGTSRRFDYNLGTAAEYITRRTVYEFG